MPYDASLPADHSPLSSAVVRNQMAGLNDLITTLQNQVSDLQTQLATRAPRVDSLSALNLPFHDPPTRDDLQAVADYSSGIVYALQQP
jgi:hypothetical protein